MSKENKIIIIVDGGLVQEVKGLPPGTEYEIHDYDTEGCDHEVDPVEEDENGKEFYRIQSVAH